VSSKSYAQIFAPTVGVAGLRQLGIRVTNVSQGDYVVVATDLTRIIAAAYIGISGNSPAINAIASTNFPSTGLTCLTLTSTAAVSFSAGDDLDILLVGPAAL
jgi:hypothetical protein